MESFEDKTKFNDESALLMQGNMMKVGRFKEVLDNGIRSKAENAILQYLNEVLKITPSLITQGAACEILQLGASRWIKGKLKLKISLEFIPDESEVIADAVAVHQTEAIAFPLDDIRQTIT